MPKRLLNKSDLKPLPKGFKRVLKKRTFKLPALTLVMMMLALGFTLSDADVLAYAAQGDYNVTTMSSQTQVTQSARWVGSGDRWQVSDNHGGYIKDCWFEDDVTGHWYMLGAEDGSVMYSGLVTDKSTGKSYLLNVNHDGTYGRMLTVNGLYNINGVDVYMTFNQEHDGTFGAILSGLQEARGAGVNERQLDRIPTDNTGNKQEQNNTPQKETQPENTKGTGELRASDGSVIPQDYVDNCREFGYTDDLIIQLWDQTGGKGGSGVKNDWN